MEADDNTVGWQLDNTYARLPEVLFAAATPAEARSPQLVILNHGLADELGQLPRAFTGVLFRAVCRPKSTERLSANCAGLCRPSVWRLYDPR